MADPGKVMHTCDQIEERLPVQFLSVDSRTSTGALHSEYRCRGVDPHPCRLWRRGLERLRLSWANASQIAPGQSLGVDLQARWQRASVDSSAIKRITEGLRACRWSS